MPPKRVASSGLTDEGLKLLEASKRWRAEFRNLEKAEEPLEYLSTTVAGALDELASASIKTMDRTKIAIATEK